MTTNDIRTVVERAVELDKLMQAWSQSQLTQMIRRHNLHPDTADITECLDSHHTLVTAMAELMQVIELCRKSLTALDPYIDSIICYASTMDEHEPNRIAENAKRALSAINKLMGE